MSRFSSNTRRSETGAALIIVLAFIVLLAAVMVIFFSQAISYRMQGNNSFNDFKSAALTQSGLETVVGDLQQEIVNGSTVVNYGVSGSPTNVYFPTSNVNAVPQTNCPWAAMPNLVRVSERSDPILAPGVNSRASADSSTNAVAGGQAFGFARWNRHYLLPRATTGATTDTTPVSSFNPPDWVYVTSASGPKVITKTDIAGGISVVGRYAYAIYNEGGLLDANVAGFPSNTATNAVHPASPATYANNSYGAPLPVWGSGLKGSEAFADLTIPAIGFTQAQIDQLVGWRNNYTAQPVSTFNAGTGMFTYSFNSSAAVNYHDAMANATNGFLTTAAGSWTDPTTTKVATDQVFLSRQALIAYVNDAGLPPDALQYLATFTRALEQPSYVPPVGRPMVAVQNTSSTVNTSPIGIANDMWHLDRVTTSPTTNAYTDINPPAQAVRVATSTFIRPDGTVASLGDLLVKKRFPLSRLSLITSTATATQSQSDPIYRNFGIYRSNATSPWIYNHDGLNPTGIDKLSTVATLGREPDFFEILRAAINVGSTGKGAAYSGNTYVFTSGGTAGYLDQAKDRLTQLQILQIGANIIDQSKADNFPTRIQFSGLPNYEVRGVEDLPYLYRVYDWIMRAGSTGSFGVVMLQPQLWNPHSTGSSSLLAAGTTPTNFRVRVGLDSTSSSMPFANLIANYYHASTTDVTASTPFNTPNTLPAPLTFNAGAPNYWDFREPTLLAQQNKPAGSNLSTTDPAYQDFPVYTPDPSRKMVGFLVASFPWINPAVGNPVYKFNAGQSGNTSCIRFYVEYQDSQGNWITYDEVPLQPWDGITLNCQIPQTSGGANVQTAQDIQSILPISDSLFGYGITDPRTSRWGFTIGQYQNMYVPVTTGPSADPSPDPVVWSTDRPDGGISYGNHVGGRKDLGFVGTANSYVNNQNRGFQHAYWAENSVRPTFQSDGSSGNSLLRYVCDPDGIPRRTLGGYVTDANNGGQAASAAQPTIGLPEANGNYSSRPTILHRPFRSVAELGYVFRDTPWGNINFTFPESGDSALLDYFCVNETADTNGLIAGRVDLNTRQAPVLAALMSGTLRDKDDSTNPTISSTMATDIASALIARTSSALVKAGPLTSRADLVGTWVGPTLATTSATNIKNAATTFTLDPNNFYSGLANDIGSVPSVSSTPTMALIPRQREAVMRALVDAGTARTWNLMIDLVAQSGRFPPKSTDFSNFVVEGEKHYWLHVAIDRYTGKVLDSQVEAVRE